MKIRKEAVTCWIIGAVLIFFGTSVENYFFETLAVIVIAFGVILQLFYDDLFKAKRIEQKTEEV